MFKNTIIVQHSMVYKLIATQLISELSGVCFAVRSVLYTSNIDTLKSDCFAYFHCIRKYQIIFWSISCNSRKIFMSILQKKTIKSSESDQDRYSFRGPFKRSEILLPYEDTFSLMNSIINNQEYFQTNSVVKR
jgi:hypothetical protein